jgi:hypothetical protein
MVLTGYGKWTRCGVRNGVEVHHALTRGRGGRILDEEGECYHLIVLCQAHHRGADGEDAYEGDLLIDGYMTRERGRAVYHGTDPYLSEKYPLEMKAIEA